MSNTGNSTSQGIVISHVVRFWLYLLFEVPSIICSIFVLGHLLFHRALRHAIYNHIIILLLFLNLIVQLTDIPWILNYNRLDRVSPATNAFCMTWVFIDEALSITTIILFAWATIERHILIFHDQWVSTRIKRIFIHYFPIGFLSLYCFCYSLVVILFPPCENIFDYMLVVCGYPLCYYNNSLVAIWDVVVNHIIPAIVIILCSATLLGRILYEKKHMHQPIRWRRHRKMTIQLLSISILYLILDIPAILLKFAYLCGVSKNIGADFMLYAKFFTYYTYLLFPFVCASSLPNLKKKIKRIFPCCRRHTHAIVPEVFHMSQKTDRRLARGPIHVY
jgi:hypothetical protein